MYETISDIKAANAKAGFHFFSADTMHFFNSRVSDTVRPVSDGAYFVTSEQYDDGSPRLFTVRFCAANGSIDTVGEFQAHTSLARALTAMHRYANRHDEIRQLGRIEP